MPTSLDPVAMPLDHLALCGDEAAPALILRKEELTFKELNQRVGQLASWLIEQDCKPGDRVASWSSKSWMTCLMPLAAARAGVVHVPINPLLKHIQAEHILRDSGAKLIIGNAARLKSIESHAGSCQMFDEKELLSSIEQLDAIGPSQHDPNDLAAILYTSGSTGRPKGVMLSHANMWLGAVSVAHYLNLAPDDVVLGVLPLSFDYGQNQLLSAWFAGASIAPLDYLTPRDVAKACARLRVTTLAAVPPLWVQLSEVDWPAEASTTMRRITNSGGALTEPLVRDLQRIFPTTDIYPMYGLTEAFRSTFLDPSLVDEHPTSMGQAIPFAEILVVDDGGKLAEPEEEGELVHCGPLVAMGYWQDPERTAERFKPAPTFSSYGGLAVWSGDRVRRDKDGLLHFVGRRDAMIKSSGNRISPQEIEEVAIASGIVAEAIALGIPDERLGHAVHLVLRADQDRSDSKQELADYLKKELPNFMYPQAMHWREKMPLNPNGKIDRTALYRELTS